MDSGEVSAAVLGGNRRALARLVSAIEGGSDVTQTLERLRSSGPGSPCVGITGPPGVGKSTLASVMIAELRRRRRTVAVLAVDPSSPLTGGALLGDRIRMQGHVDDPGVYIRSMASRGHLGGLANAAEQTLLAIRHSGFDFVLVETVGVGQSEVEVMHLADPVILVLTPGWGDQVQADKAGIVEIADILVINKGDRPGVEELRRALIQSREGRATDILVTTATTGEGVASLVDLVQSRF